MGSRVRVPPRSPCNLLPNGHFFNRSPAARLQVVGNIWWLVGKLLFSRRSSSRWGIIYLAPHPPDIVKAGGIADSSGEAGAPETRELRPTKLATLDGVRQPTEGSAVAWVVCGHFMSK